jgi:hypothetical protein
MNARTVTSLASLALVLVLAACQAEVSVSVDDGGPGVRRYEGNGIAFDYPDAWEQIDLGDVTAETGTELWSVAFGPNDLSFVAVSAYRLQIEVTQDNVDDILPELRSTIASLAQQSAGEVVTDFTPLDVGGFPAYTVEVTSTVPTGEAVHSVLYFIFEDTTEYFVNCQFAPEDDAAIRGGCDMVSSSFSTTS